MDYGRIHNFAAGPAVLPLSVVERLREQLPNLHETGIGLMEISHRSKTFDDIVRSAQARLARVLGIPSSHEILFLQGGASLQFLMAPMNLLNPGEKADYLDTGAWSRKAIKEARTQGDIRVAWTGEDHNYCRVPVAGDYTVREDAVYLHYTSNNTIFGTEFLEAPDSAGKPLVVDASSDIASRPIDVARHAVIYAGAQKNLGPSGITVVVVERSYRDRCEREIPTLLDYNTHIAKKTLFNTPNTLGCFVLDQVLAWIEDQGGLEAVHGQNEAKADLLYQELDRTGFWKPHADRASRSRMNVTWRISDADLEPVFLEEATAAGLSGLKGHRSVGGLRASIYNACPSASVKALVDFMQDFERRHG